MADIDNLNNRVDSDEDLKDTYELVERLEQMIIQARSVPFSSNCMVDREEALVLVGLIRDGLPVELKQAKWLLDQSRELLETARQQATEIVEDAQHEVAKMIDEHEITQQARRYATETVQDANREAESIHEAAISYTEQRLTHLEDQLTELLVTVRKNKKDLQDNP
jgi:vacuolar-type H+-ATPase subunit H